MPASARIGATDERPIFFPAAREMLFGVLSMPGGGDGRPGVVMLGGGGTTPTATGRNRFYVSLCRRLASVGYPTLRFDYHGLGDSTGRAEFRLDRPFVDDLHGAVATFRRSGVENYVLVGMCFGARTALAGAPGLRKLAGLVLLAPPVRDYALSEPKTAGWGAREYVNAALHPGALLGPDKKLTVRRYARFVRSGARIVLRRARDRLRGREGGLSWVSARFLGPLRTVAERGVPVLLLYGTDDEEYEDFRTALEGGLRDILDGFSSVEVATLEGEVHGFTRLASQGPTMDLVTGWIQRNDPGETVL